MASHRNVSVSHQSLLPTATSVASATVVESSDLSSLTWLRLVSVIALTGALFVSAFEGYLLERKFGYFHGGFLAGYHLEGRGATGAFLLASVASDFLIVALVSAAVFHIAAQLRLRRAATACLALVAALGPIIVDNFVAYELFRYLGDELNLPVLVALTGGAPGELIAVGNSHGFLLPAAAIFGGVLLIGAFVWGINRHGPGAALPRAPRPRRAGTVMAAYAVTALVIAAGLRVASDTIDFGMRRKSTGKIVGALVGFVTDVDRDGYGLFDRPADPSPFKRAIRPYALDIPGNGIDENGVGGDLPPGNDYVESPTATRPWKIRPNVMFVMLESVRADAIGSRIDGRPVTPALDQLVARGVSSAHMYSHNGFTPQSRHHTLSGSLASLRGPSTLLDDFHAHGYEVAFFSAQDESFGGPAFTVRPSSADVFFHAADMPERRFSRFSTPGSLALPFDVLEEQIYNFLDHRHHDKPLFLYVNFQDTHFPYGHSGVKPLVSAATLRDAEIQPEAQGQLRAMYLNTLANVDAAIGRLLARARERLSADPAVVVTSDHGESLFEQGFLGHGYALNDAQTRVPLIVVGLPMVIGLPMGQADLRDAIGRALEGANVTAGPTTAVADHPVFQYLGLIDRPSEIGFVSGDGRVVYDFRRNQVQTTDGRWLRPKALDRATSQRYLNLVRFWERLVLARARPGHRD